jgi:mRNA-degrading endonuclease YafQ of YafQ-DinJ toxin-antitoxin module
VSLALIRSSGFVRAARKHIRRHPEHASDIFEVFTQLAEDPFHSSLRTHKLTGDLAGSWACSAGYDLRVIFKIVKQAGKPAILLEALGTHDEVY